MLQERFLVTGRNKTSDKTIYWIPITIATKSAPNFENTLPLFWLGFNGVITDQLNITDEWFILNVQQAGYYRVNYDERGWNNLTVALKADNFSGIPEINRAQIVDDSLNLARAGYISYDLALTVTEYLMTEENHLPWRAFFTAISFLYERFDGHDAGIKLKEHILTLVNVVYLQLGFEGDANDSQMTRLNRQLILAWVCRLGNVDCVDKAKKIFTEWRSNITQMYEHINSS